MRRLRRRQTIKALRLFMVYLIKRSGGEVKTKSAQFIRNGFPAPKHIAFFSQNHIGFPGIEIDYNGSKTGERFPQAGDQLLGLRKFSGTAYQANHQFAGSLSLP